jgi:hypothetical protein
MWEPRHLTLLWAFTACYRDSFTYFTLLTYYVLICNMLMRLLMSRKSASYYGYKYEMAVERYTWSTRLLDWWAAVEEMDL